MIPVNQSHTPGSVDARAHLSQTQSTDGPAHTDANGQVTTRQETMAAAKQNSVVSLQNNNFTRRSLEEKKRIKELGPDQPDLKIQQQASDRGRSYTRGFSRLCYAKHSWLTGCEVSNALYCFPCLLFQSVGTEPLWTTTGVRDLKHLSEKCKRHESSRSHLDNSMKLQFSGRISMLSMEKRLVCEMTDFNQKVIEKFAGLKERRAKFMFK